MRHRNNSIWQSYLLESVPNPIPNFGATRVRSDKFGNAEARLQLQHSARQHLGLTSAAEAGQGGGLQDNGKAEARFRL